ncbi:MAG TPA: tetratricopeptide repeat protein [Polyangia bacterium]|jgi:tetratricopeptide (TPR) repeat protein|nr:tetratricopeptide repeat protein [Polyangia bacterium]
MAKDIQKKSAAPKPAKPAAKASAKTSQPVAPTKKAAPPAAETKSPELQLADAKARLAAAGRNDPCPCGSGKKYKKCHLQGDEAAVSPPAGPPDPKETLANAWRLFEQRRPGAAEKEFRAALEADPDLTDARVGIGMARLSAGNTDGAREELSAVVTAGEKQLAELRAEKVKDAFTRPTAQPLIRASHALGCLAYDEDRFEDAAKELERVYAIDEGTVGTEARLISAKALMKLNKPADAVAVLEPAQKSEVAGSRAQLGLALAHFAAGAAAKARAALDSALEANPHFGKALLGRVRRRVENLAGSQPGSLEEALVYTQTYGDVWTDDAKKFLEEVVDGRAAQKPAAGSSDTEEATTG